MPNYVRIIVSLQKMFLNLKSVILFFRDALIFHSVRSNSSCRFMPSKADIHYYEMKLLNQALYVNIMLIINPVAGFYSILLSLQKVL